MLTRSRIIGRAEERSTPIPVWDRLGAASGIAFAVLMLAGIVLLDPVSGQSDQTFTDFYAERDNRIAVIAGMYLLAIAGACFLVFLGTLRRTLRRAEGDSGNLTAIVFAGGIVFVATLFAGGAAMGVVATSISLGGEPQPSPAVGRLFTQLGYTLILLFGMVAGSVLITATSALAMRTGTLPRWLAWAGFASAVLLLTGVIFVSAIALPLWVVAVSVALLRHGDAMQPIRQAASSPA